MITVEISFPPRSRSHSPPPRNTTTDDLVRFRKFDTPSHSTTPENNMTSKSQSQAPHKWTSFEVRTLVCLIIKGEHLVARATERADRDSTMDLADKLNTALHPGDAARDIPVADVEAMLRRVLARRRHAVDLCRRDGTDAVTKKKINAFMRALDFDGGDDEWTVGGRRTAVAAERPAALARLMARAAREEEGRAGAGGPPAPPGESEDEREDREARLEMIEDPRAYRLLADWGMGATFWEGESVVFSWRMMIMMLQM